MHVDLHMVGVGIASDTNTGELDESTGKLGDSAGGVSSKNESVTTGIKRSLLPLVTCDLSSSAVIPCVGIVAVAVIRWSTCT